MRILTGCRVRTLNRSSLGVIDALLVSRTGKILHCGDEASCISFAKTHCGGHPIEIEKFPPETCLLPAFHDCHCHPLGGWLQRARCNLSRCKTLPQVLDRIASACSTLLPHQWLVGGGWTAEHFKGHPAGPTAAMLDSICGRDRPVYLRQMNGHDAWVNTRALELAGIYSTANVSVDDGIIIRDRETGLPTGFLMHKASSLVSELIPPVTDEEMQHYVQGVSKYALKFGITSFLDAKVRPKTFDAYLAAARKHQLPLSVHAALHWMPDKNDGAKFGLGAPIRRQLISAGGSNFHADTVKVFLDGLTENATGLVYEPYVNVPKALQNQGPTCGKALFSKPELIELFKTLSDESFHIHCHATGDAAATLALDAFEAVRNAEASSNTTGPSKIHCLAHAFLVRGEDIPRFAKLSVGAAIQSLWMCREAMPISTKRVGSPRDMMFMRCRSLLEAGCKVGFSSDWPVSSMNPLEGIEVAVTRLPVAAQRPSNYETPRWNYDERIALLDAFRCYTKNAAEVMGRHDVGVIAPQMQADLVLLKSDPFEEGQKVEGLAERCAVLATFVAGKRVYSAV